MPPAIDGGDRQRIAEPVEGQRAGQRNHMPAIDQPAAEAALAFGILVEMDARGVLVEPGRHHVLGFFDRHAVDMVDSFAGFVIVPQMAAARGRQIAIREIRVGGHAQLFGRDRIGQFRHHGFADLGRRIAFVDHDPAHIGEHQLARLVIAFGADIDDAGLPVGILLEPDHLREGGQGRARIDGFDEAALGIAEIGHRIERDVRHGLAEHGVEDEQIVQRRLRKAEALRKGIGRLQREARAIERGVKRRIAFRQRARRRMHQLLADAEILEEIAGVRFGHVCLKRNRCLCCQRPELLSNSAQASILEEMGVVTVRGTCSASSAATASSVCATVR